MFDYTPFFIGLRYIKSKQRHRFLSFISGFSLVGMALGTLSLITVLSVMNGFDREIKSRILQVVPHGFIDKVGGLSDWRSLTQSVQMFSGVKSAAPYIGGFAMLSSSQGVQGSQIQAVLPNEEKGVSSIHQFISQGAWHDLRAGEFGIVLGHFLASFLQVGVGDDVVMTLPKVNITPIGVFPRTRRFKVVAIFEVGAQVDQNLAIIHLTDAQKLFRYGFSVQGLRLQVDDIYQANDIISNVQSALGRDYSAKDWTQTQGNLFQAIQMEKRMVAILLSIIVVVAALNIVTGLALMVADKRSNIAVLRTLGMRSRGIMMIFVVQGAVTGIIGILIGVFVGCLLAFFIGDIVAYMELLLGVYVFDPSVYFVSKIPSHLKLGDVVLIGVMGMVVSILATLYPAARAAQIQPAEVLRYE